MKVALIGQPNSGKSLIFSRLTGFDALVSNYPGTSLEIARGNFHAGSKLIELVDTPGIHSLALAEGSADVTKRIVLCGEMDLLLNVVDAGNLARNLSLTLELVELGLPMIVLLNQIEFARAKSIRINQDKLARLLGCLVIPFSARTGEGIPELKEILAGQTGQLATPQKRRQLLPGPESALECTGDCYGCLRQKTGGEEEEVLLRYQIARGLAEQVIEAEKPETQLMNRLEYLLDNTGWGTLILVLLAVAGFGLLLAFVGWAEGLVSSAFLPVQSFISRLIAGIVAPGFWNNVLSKGVPEGILIPFSLVMPAMLMVSLIISVLEDVGLLPRYAVVLERLGRVFGVSGQAVIPLSLGFGCRTPAVAATRILPGWEQRFIIVTLLSIVVPCAGTIGMLASTIAAFHAYTAVIITAIVTVFLGLGWVMKKIYGEDDEPVYELPSLRLPTANNLATKIRLRFKGFFTEVLPLLLVMSVGVRIIIDSGVLTKLKELEPLTTFLFGIPPEAVVGVLVTIVQRYLAPLILLNLSLSPREATIAIAMIALSVPCLPVMVMTIRELGMKSLLKIITLGFSISFAVGIVLNLLLP